MLSGAEIERFAEGRRVVTYSRVSTQEQDPDMQIYALREFAATRGFTIQKEYVDIVTGSIEKRERKNLKAPALEALMADVRARKIDCVVVWKYDRFARSLLALITALQEFQRLGVGFVSATQSLDTTTPTGRLMFEILAAFSDYERHLICERVRAGLEKARAKGTHLGARERDPSAGARMRALRNKGTSLRNIGKIEGYSATSVMRILRRTPKPPSDSVPLDSRLSAVLPPPTQDVVG